MAIDLLLPYQWHKLRFSKTLIAQLTKSINIDSISKHQLTPILKGFRDLVVYVLIINMILNK